MISLARFAAAVVLLTFLAAAQACVAETIWVEGEKPDSTTMNRHPWWYDKVKSDELSGGGWISNFNKDKEGAATYTFAADKAGDYAFWLRGNPVGTKLGYSIDGGAERDVDFAGAVDQRNVAEDGKIDIRFVAWAKIGTVTLAAGKHKVAFRAHSENSNHGAIDCFCFTTEDFSPSGTSKPGASTDAPVAAANGETWPFNPGEDKFGTDALLDLRGMNEAVAGEHGTIKLSADGMSFVRGDGQPIRFWAANVGGQSSQENIDNQLRFMAKKGVNMIRLHRSIPNAKEGAKITDVDEKELDTIFKYVAAARKNGIYVTLSPYWASLRAPKSWGIEDYAGQSLWGVLFFNDDLQAAYKAWTRELYTRVNPYTGVALKDDPSVAVIQCQNEDSLLFWTFQGIKPAQRRILGRKFGDWLAKKYGSLDKAAAAWGSEKLKEDDIAGGVVGFMQTWNLLQAERGNAAKRAADQTEFLGWLSHAFYADLEAHYRSLGCKQLVNAMNWRSADPVKLDDLERYTYSATDVEATNSYFGGMHVGTNNGYRIDPGHYLTNKSALKEPLELTSNLKQVVGHPMLITEVAWTHPNLYQSEGPFLMAAYQSLTGVDATYWFSMGERQWLKDPRRMFWPVGKSHAVDKWSTNTPTCLGMFPAYAVAFRQGLIKQADRPAVYEERAMEDLYQRKTPIISEGGKFDPNRDAGSFAPESTIKQEVDRLAFLVGPVHVKFGGSAANNRVVDLAKYIDRASGKVTSLTGQIEFDTKRAVCTVKADAFAGACGFLKEAGEAFELGAVSIKSENEYATVGVVAMDGQPLGTSKRVLVQVGTTAKLTEYTTKKAEFSAEGGGRGRKVEGEQIVDNGKPPWAIANTRATVTIKNAGLTKATLVDANGYAAGAVAVTKIPAGGGVTIELPANAMYVIVE